MSSSQLLEVIKSGNKHKIAIGFSVSGYKSALKTMGSIYDKNDGNTQIILTDDGNNAPLQATSSGLGLTSFIDQAAVNGYLSNYQLAVVQIVPNIPVPFVPEQSNTLSVATFPQGFSTDGTILGGKKQGVPDTFNIKTLEACSADNGGDFIVGVGLSISGDFGQGYVNHFYSNDLSKDDIVKLASEGYLYAEVFFPAETSAFILMARVIYDTQDTTQVAGNMTFWNCYVPAPVLLLDDYNQYFEMAVGNNIVTSPSYGSDAIYSYVNATIQGFSPQVITNNISSGTPTTAAATLLKWPGFKEDSTLPNGVQPAYAKVRLLVPPDKVTAAEQSLGKTLPQTFKSMTDTSIATGIVQNPVMGGDALTSVSNGVFWYDESKLGKYISYSAWCKTFRTIFAFETATGNADVTWADITAGEGKGANNETFVSWGPTQLCGVTLERFLIDDIGVDRNTAERLAQGKNDSHIQTPLSDSEIFQNFQKINELVRAKLGDNFIQPVMKYWWNVKGDIVLRGYNAARFQNCPLGFAMCVYIANQGTGVVNGGTWQGMAASTAGIPSQIGKCKDIANQWKSKGNWKHVKAFWTYVSNKEDIDFTGTYDMSKFDKKGMV